MRPVLKTPITHDFSAFGGAAGVLFAFDGACRCMFSDGMAADMLPHRVCILALCAIPRPFGRNHSIRNREV